MIKHTATAIRIMIGVGAYGEIADDTRGSGSTTLALRLKYEGQGDELTTKFPGTHVSAVTDPRSISIVGPAAKLHELFCYAREHERLQVQKMDIRGQVHNPDNAALAKELCSVCRDTPILQLPDARALRAPVRSNRSGECLTEGSLTDELVTTILASRCEWWSLLNRVAQDVQASGQDKPALVYFGLTDCVATTPFVKLGLRPSKTGASALIPSIERAPTRDAPGFPENAIAVVGASCRLPGASNLEQLWELLAAGQDCHRELPDTRFDLKNSFRATQSSSFVKDRRFFGNFLDDIQGFDHSFFGINPREAASMDPQQRLLLEVAYEALEDAGYLHAHQRESGDNVGCFIGASLVEYLDNTNAHAPTAYTSTGTIRAFLCGRLSYLFGWSGPAEVVDTACSSSLVAINRACKAIQAGECRMALAGGVNLITGMNNYFDLGKAGFLSPTGQCKPFDVAADGYCRSDGAGLVVLKTLKHAIASGDAILGVIPGVTTNQGGLSASITVPHSVAQMALYRQVLGQAGIPAESVTYVESHGTGTQAGDPLEMESIRSVFGREASDNTLFVGSIKGNLGHCETAAGVAGLLKVLAMLKHKQVPPQANHIKLNPKIAPLEPDGLAISRSLTSWNVPLRAALVNSYGAAGSNCALLCCEMPLPATKPSFETASRTRSMALPVSLSGNTVTSVLANARAIRSFLERPGTAEDLDLADVAYTLNQRRKKQKHVASLEATNVKHFAALLGALDSQAVFQPPSASPPSIIFVFSGQSDTKVGLDKALYQQIPALRFHIDACDDELQSLGYPSIIPGIFETSPLPDATTLQCCIFTMQYATAQCWIASGVVPRAAIGHSLGELTALAVSGVLSLRDALRLVAARASLIDSDWGAEKGAMLALSGCSSEQFDKIRDSVRQRKRPDNIAQLPQVEVACYNGPASLVAVGTGAAIDVLEDVVRTETSLQGIRTQRLSTSHGFHSALTEPLLERVRALSQSLQWNEPSIPLEACQPAHLDSFKAYDAARHFREPVHFVDAVQRLEERLGPSLWLEAGVDTAAIPLARASCSSQQKTTHNFLAFKTTGVARPVDAIAGVVANLWKSGHVQATHWRLASYGPDSHHIVTGCKPVWLPPYQFERTSSWLANVDRAAEMQRLLAERPLSSKPAAPAGAPPEPVPVPRLVTVRGASGSERNTWEFCINTRSQRFSHIVGGHCIRGRCICPASMYMECVTMALQLLLEDPRSKQRFNDDVRPGSADLSFDALSFASPLGVEPAGDGEVLLRLDTTIGDQPSWKFSFRTVEKNRVTTHAGGLVSLGGKSDLGGVQRLVASAAEQIRGLDRADVEVVKATRVYGLFARVVDYAPFFRAVRTLTFRGCEGLASVALPVEQPGVVETSARAACDAVAMDAAVQVVGLMMNTSDAVAHDEVMVMVGLEHVTLSHSHQWDASSSDGNELQVYARFGYNADQQPIGDVFVHDTCGDLVAVLSGCRFSKLPVMKLERSLDQALRQSSRANLSHPIGTPHATGLVASESGPSGTDTATSGAGVLTPATSDEAAGDLNVEEIRSLIIDCTGVDASDMSDDALMVDLGLDSLASVELVGELASRFGIAIDSNTLMSSNLNDLTRYKSDCRDEAAKGEPARAGTDPETTSKASEASNAVGNKGQERIQIFTQILMDVLGAKAEDIKPGALLVDLGVDSMSANDLKQEVEDVLSVKLDQVSVEDTVGELMRQTGVSVQPAQPKRTGGRIVPSNAAGLAGSDPDSVAVDAITSATVLHGNPFDALKEADAQFSTSAKSQNFFGHWSEVAPFEDEILLAYIVEAFAELGVDLDGTSPGGSLSQVPHLTKKYDKLVPRLWAILEKHGIVAIGPTGSITRGSAQRDKRPSAQLLAAFRNKFPGYEHESNLIGLTGPRLAECLTGKLNPVTLMFGSPSSMKTMENFYGQSPMMSTLTEQLVIFVTNLLRNADKSRPVRILEVGAGTGGTTKRLAAALAAAGVSAVYTFTDIAPSLVSKAKMTLKQYPWFEYASFNLENEVPPAFQGRFDVVISTNCVHATTDRTLSCRRLRETLVPGGILVLSEVTRVIDWYDVCFGYLDGWWLAEGRTMYPIQPASHWMTVFKAAGFPSASHSDGPSLESTSQQLLVACNAPWESGTSSASGSMSEDRARAPGVQASHRMETVTYKEVSNVQIQADIYFPGRSSNATMPVGMSPFF